MCWELGKLAGYGTSEGTIAVLAKKLRIIHVGVLSLIKQRDNSYFLAVWGCKGTPKKIMRKMGMVHSGIS